MIAVLLGLGAASAVRATTVVASHTLRAHTRLALSDMRVVKATVAGALSDPAGAVGLEARIVLYAGRPIHPADIGPPALVRRNQIVRLIFRRGPLTITADGRALGRAGKGDRVRVMNLDSHSTVVGTVTGNGLITVGPVPGE